MIVTQVSLHPKLKAPGFTETDSKTYGEDWKSEISR